jgi:hypothetical protein
VVDAAVDHGGTDNPALAPETASEQHVMPKKPEFTEEEQRSMVDAPTPHVHRPPISKLKHAAPQVNNFIFLGLIGAP